MNDKCTSCASALTDLKLYGSTVCAEACESGTYENGVGDECLLCESTCGTCNGGLATNCLSCGIVNGVPRYLDGSVCQTNCPGSQYEDIYTYTCAACATGCLTCDKSASNCSSCQNTGGSTDYFKQPNENTCLEESCPSGYFK